MRVKIKLLSPEAKIPCRKTEFAAGYDVYALQDTEIQPGATKLVPTGIAIEIPAGYYIMLAPRGSMAMKHHLDMPHSVGIFDSDYRGEYFVPLRNLSTEKVFKIEKGERVAQLILQKHETMEFEKTDELSETKRGTGGLGSTGKF